jgi:hypothetical protein
MNIKNMFSNIIKEMNTGSPGIFNRPLYDNNIYRMDLANSTAPLAYQMYAGKYENCQKCIYDKFYMKQDLVQVESELKNITRPLSGYPGLQYHPGCPASEMCLSTYSPLAPVTPSPEICPITRNNIPRRRTTGITMPNPDPSML